MSLIVPDRPFDTDVIKTFCRFVHFFADESAGQQWVAEHRGTFLATVADAYKLGQLINSTAFGAALSNGGVAT
ncbi:MAG: organomercurial lyase [Solirubrobacteraceae bacterium]